MSLLIGFLTFILVVNCLLLLLLVLIQLPKKEAGAGIAFGGAATDALFGAGSGNALTKMTKYSAAIFVGLSLSLSVLNSNSSKASNRRLEAELLKKSNEPTAPVPSPLSTPAVSLPDVSSQSADALPVEAAPNELKTQISNEVTATVGTVSGAAGASLESGSSPETTDEQAEPTPPAPENPPE